MAEPNGEPCGFIGGYRLATVGAKPHVAIRRLRGVPSSIFAQTRPPGEGAGIGPPVVTEESAGTIARVSDVRAAAVTWNAEFDTLGALRVSTYEINAQR